MPMSHDENVSRDRILTINAGSSSIKFAVFESGSFRRTLSGRIEGIGSSESVLAVDAGGSAPSRKERIEVPDPSRANERLIDWLKAEDALEGVAAVGHRVVHGGVRLLEHRRVTPELVAELEENRDLDPAHLPQEIALIRTFGRALPGVAQVACLDTAFHRDLPRVAQLLPIPRRYLNDGVRRLGFHGLSYTYLMGELRRAAGDAVAHGRVVLAHLGSGASLAAVRGGRPIDTSMAFTAAAGLVMGTRTGDLDPGLLLHLMRLEGGTAASMEKFVNERCGLLGVSGSTSDMKALLSMRDRDSRAADAVGLFCYQAAKWIGAFAAALGGLETLVFSGGIGERSAAVRREICSRLEFLDVAVDAASNETHGAVISDARSAVSVRVIPTDEEIVIARIVSEILEKS